MKKIFIALAATLSLALPGAALADDGAATFRTYCQSCHGTDGSRAPAPGITPIKGQNAADLVKMLEGYQEGTFGGQMKQVMEGVARRLTDVQIRSVSDYVSNL